MAELSQIRDSSSPAILGRAVSVAALLIIVVIAGYLRAAHLNDSLWLDELHSSWVISGDWSDIVSRAGLGNHPPLYFWILRIVQEVAGESEIFLRSISWLSGVTLLLVAYAIVIKWSRSRIAGLAVIGAMAVDTNLIFYSQEARAYSLVQLLGLISLASFHKYATTGSALCQFVWIATTVLAFYLHYTTALIPLGQIGFVLLVISCHRFSRSAQSAFPLQTTIRNVVWDLSLLFFAVAPAVPHLLTIGKRRSNWNQFIDEKPLSAVIGIFPETLLVGAGAMALCVVAAVGMQHWFCMARVQRRLSPILYCLTCIVIPTVTTFAISDLARLFYRRYLVAMIPMNYVLTAILVSLPTTGPIRACVAAVVLVAACWRSSAVDCYRCRLVPPALSNEDWRGAVDRINHNPLRLVFVRPHLIEDQYLRSDRRGQWLEYCRLPLRALYRINDNSSRIEPLPSTDAGVFEQNERDALFSAREAWLLFRGRPGTLDVAIDQMRKSMSSHGVHLDIGPRERYGGNLTLLKLAIRDR